MTPDMAANHNIFKGSHSVKDGSSAVCRCPWREMPRVRVVLISAATALVLFGGRCLCQDVPATTENGPATVATAERTSSVSSPEPTPESSSGNTMELVVRAWNHPVLTVGRESIRLSQVVIAAAIFLAGVWVSRRIAVGVRERLTTRGRMDINAAAAMAKVLHYLLLLMVVLWALRTLRIPLTMFTFLGGAVAIGVGFGAQNIIGNFISGLILMTERPIRIGDLVEVESHLGRVEDIGARCTRVKRIDGIDVLVPNSVFVEKSVINWTLCDKLVRTSVTVGVMYGSPTDRVAELIRRAADEHDNILREPEPRVVFQDFGDSALVFEVFFWAEVTGAMELRVIRSDVRFRIDALFRDAGIVIAFPQHDVHLDSSRPIELKVRRVPDGGDTESVNKQNESHR